jgi:hypothetical protein
MYLFGLLNLNQIIIYFIPKPLDVFQSYPNLYETIRYMHKIFVLFLVYVVRKCFGIPKQQSH